MTEEVHPQSPLETKLARWLPYLVAIPILGFWLLAMSRTGGTYLHPDEAQQFMRANTADIVTAWKWAFTQSHPPLYILLIHLALYISYSQVFLRGISITAAAAAAWLLFRWLQRAFDDRVAVVGLALFISSPALLIAPTMIRQYGTLLFFVCAALYCMERIFSDRNWKWVLWYSAAVIGIFSTFYGGGWVVIALGLYMPLRLWLEKAPRPVVMAWLGTQAVGGAMGLYLFFYHVLRLEEDINWASASFLRGSYRSQEAANVWNFIRSSNFRVGQYFAHGLPLSVSQWQGMLLLALFAIGIALIAFGKRRRDYAFLLLVPVALACAGGAAKLLPYGGTRHVAYLLPFFCAGAAVAVATLVPRMLVLVPLAALIIPWRMYNAQPALPVQRMAMTHMEQVLRYLKTNVPQEGVIITDRQSFFLLRFYLTVGPDMRPRHNDKSQASYFAGYRVISPAGRSGWTFQPRSLLSQVVELADEQLIRPGTPIWVVTHTMADVQNFETVLPASSTYQRFGVIQIMQLPLPRRPRAAALRNG